MFACVRVFVWVCVCPVSSVQWGLNLVHPKIEVSHFTNALAVCECFKNIKKRHAFSLGDFGVCRFMYAYSLIPDLTYIYSSRCSSDLTCSMSVCMCTRGFCLVLFYKPKGILVCESVCVFLFVCVTVSVLMWWLEPTHLRTPAVCALLLLTCAFCADDPDVLHVCPMHDLVFFVWLLVCSILFHFVELYSKPV